MNEHSDDILINFGSEVKALGDGKVGGYLVRFSTNQDPDLSGDFFTAKTDFGEASMTPVYYHHGMDSSVGVRRIGKAQMKLDEVGVWIEAQLEMRDGYEKAIYALAEKGKLGWSSGTASHLVSREQQGKAMWIKSWPLGLDASLTPTPAEPRNNAMSLKAIEVTSLEPTETGGEPVAHDETTSTNNQSSHEGKSMSEDNKPAEVTEMKAAEPKNEFGEMFERIQDELKAKNAAQLAESKKAEALEEGIRNLITETMKAAPAINRGAPALNLKTKRGDDEMKSFMHYMRTGDVGAYKAAITLNEGDDEQGLATVPKAFVQRIVEKRGELSILRQAGAEILTVDSKTVDIPVEKNDTVDAAPASTNESAGATEVSYDMNQVEPLDTVEVSVTKYTRMHKISEELLSDTKADIEGFLARRVGRAFALLENTLFITPGTAGSIVYGSTKGKDAAAGTSIAVGDVQGLYFSLPDYYRDGAVWIMAPATQGAIMSLQGNPFSYQATPAGSINDAILNHRVFTTSAMSAIGVNNKSVLFGNPNFYTLVENGGFKVKRLTEAFAAYGEVGFLFSTRLGGAVTQNGALMHLLHPSA